MKTPKQWVKLLFPEAFCCRLRDGTGFIVWPQRDVGPRGSEMAAIGLGKNAKQAWESANETTKVKPMTSGNIALVVIREQLRLAIEDINNGNRALIEKCSSPEEFEAIVPELTRRIERRGELQRELCCVG